MLTHNPFSRKRNLTMDQRLQYQVTATHYLTGIAPLLLILVPPLQIYFNLTPMNLTITPLTWLLYYSGFYVLQIVLAFYTLGSFRWQVLLLAAVSFPIYTRALINAIFRRDQKWHVTGQKGAYRSPFAFMMPQVLFFQFLLITTVVGVWKDLGNGYPSLALAWNATNTLILGSFVVTAWREGHRGRLAAKAERSVRRDQPRPSRDRTHRRCRMTWASRFRLLVGTILVLVLAALATYKLNENEGRRRERLRADPRQDLRRGHALRRPGRRPDGRRRRHRDEGRAAVRHRLGEPAVRHQERVRQAGDRGHAGRRPGPPRAPGDRRRHGDRRSAPSAARSSSPPRSSRPSSAPTPLYVQAEYTLTPNEYARVADNATATVELPNHRTITAHVYKVKVETVAGQAQAVMTLTGSALKDGAQNGLVSAGTPVTAELQLRNDGVVTRTADSVKTYIEGIFG